MLIVLLLFCGQATPQDSDIDADEVVTLFPTLARQTDSGGWEIPIHGWIYEPEARVESLDWFLRQLGLVAPDEPAAAALLARRAAPFLVDNERNQRIPIRVGGQTAKSEPSHPNGHFRLTVIAAAEATTKPAGSPPLLRVHALPKPGDSRTFPGTAYLLDSDGVSVVSDIDDTIKVSNVRDKSELLKNTFVRPFKSVDGMAELYTSWAGGGAAFHYVSASPWQLFGALDEFRAAEGFPAGSFHLKTFRLKDETFLSLFESPEAYKTSTIRELIRRFPKRRFILIGDSGERDPEAYAALRREFPQNVAAILLRDVTGEGRDAQRYRNIFRDVPADDWQVFREPEEIEVPNILTQPNPDTRAER